MAILVTGGAGYIGSVVVDDLIANGETVGVIDDLSRGQRAAVNEKAVFYEGGIGDSSLVAKIIGELDVTAVMHFSAYAYVGESVEKPHLYYQNNVIETVKLLDTMNRCGAKQIVFSSSCATFGEPERVPIEEYHPQRPTNPYGRTKLIVEQILGDYDRAYELRSVALRYFNACGATETRGELHDPETHLIPLILDAAAGKIDRLSVFGGDYPTPDGTAVRDYIHVSDLSDAHIRAVKHLANGGASGSFNLGNGKGFSVLEVIEAAKRVTGRDVPYKIEPRRPGDPSQLVAGAEKAQNILGWRPRHTELESMIESAWRWRSSSEESSAKSVR